MIGGRKRQSKKNRSRSGGLNFEVHSHLFFPVWLVDIEFVFQVWDAGFEGVPLIQNVPQFRKTEAGPIHLSLIIIWLLTSFFRLRSTFAQNRCRCHFNLSGYLRLVFLLDDNSLLLFDILVRRLRQLLLRSWSSSAFHWGPRHKLHTLDKPLYPLLLILW